MVENIKIPKGYKQTDVGVIPEDWDVSTIVKHASITTGSKNTQDKVADGLYRNVLKPASVNTLLTL